MLPGLLIGLWAQMKLHFAYSKYSQVPAESGMTGAGSGAAHPQPSRLE